VRVLVVEDDLRLGPILQQGLEEDGIGVDSDLSRGQSIARSGAGLINATSTNSVEG